MQTLVSDLLTLSRLEGSPLPGAADWTPVPSAAGAVRAGGEALSAPRLGKALDLRFGAGAGRGDRRRVRECTARCPTW
jgi:two-component system phosphate regulon sensor histidine kinase PhoR